jgi:pyrroline-5-carboxylate reductase
MTPFPERPTHNIAPETVSALFAPLCAKGPHEVAEKCFDIATSLAGSGPAYAMVVAEAMADAGVAMGLTRAVSIEMACGAMLGNNFIFGEKGSCPKVSPLQSKGAASLTLESGTHPAVLRDSITTPGGCTIAGIMKMEEGNVRSTVARGVVEGAIVARNGMAK